VNGCWPEVRKGSSTPRSLIEWDKVRALQFYQLLRQGALIGIAVLLAKSPLAPEAIGEYEMLMYIGYVFTFFWVSGLIQGLLSLFPRHSTADQGRLFFQSYLLFFALSAVLALGLLLLKGPVLRLMTGNAGLTQFELMLLFLFLHSPTFLLEHFLLLKDRPGEIAWLGLASFFLQIAAVIIPVFLGWGLQGIFAGLVLFAVVRHIWLLVFLGREGEWSFTSAFLRSWWVLSLPLVLYTLLGGFHQAFDNWLVGWHYRGDETQFALFRYGARELPLALALANALGTGLLPQLSGDLQVGLSALRAKSRRLFHFLFPLSIILMLSSYNWFPLVFSEAFLPSVPVFNLFLLIVISRLIFSRTILMALQDNQVILWLSVLELMLNIGLSLALVGRMGLAGIALGTVLATAIDKVLLCLLLYYRHGVGLSHYVDLRWFTAYSALLLLTFFYVS